MTAQAALRVAIEEIAKVLLLNQAVYWEKDDQKRWDYLWRAWDDHREKLRTIQYLYHWDSNQDRDEFSNAVTVLRKSREWLWYVDFDPIERAYRAPQIRHISEKEAEEVTLLELKYAEMLLSSLTPVTAGSLQNLIKLVPQIRSTHERTRDWPQSYAEDEDQETDGGL